MLLDDEPQQCQMLPFALDIYGCLHLLDNICKDFPEKLAHWQKFAEQLHVCWVFLSDRGRRERFVHTCMVVDDPAAVLFKEFSGQLLDHRWFSVFTFVAKLRPLLVPLCRCWSSDKYVKGVDSGSVAQSKFDPERFTDILDDRLFHAYGAFVHRIGKLMKHLSKWD